MSLPNVFIIGAAKSGTTSLAINLGAHPDVHMAFEPHFFNNDSNWRRGRTWYEAQFAKAGRATVVADKTPAYLFDRRVPERIAATLPEPSACTYVAILREPTARALSDVEHRRRLGREPREAAVALTHNLRTEPGEATHDYVRMGFYAEQLRRYVDRFGAPQLHVEFYEDLVDDPASVYQRLFARLGVADFTGFDAEEPMNRSARLRYPTVYRALHAVRAGQWLPPRVGRWVWKKLQEPTRYAPLPAELRRELRDLYAPHNAALADLVGRALPSAWAHESGPTSGGDGGR